MSQLEHADFVAATDW